jgi:hypothetical protein
MGKFGSGVTNGESTVVGNTSVTEVSPVTPTGSRGNRLDVTDGSNVPSTIGNLQYSGHALDRMQTQGITPSVVENAIIPGNAIPGKFPGTTAYYDSINRLTVITDTKSGKIITIDYGRIKQ